MIRRTSAGFAALGQKIVMNIQINFGANLQVRIDQTIEGMRHHAFSRVLDRHHAQCGAVLADLLKDLGDAGRRAQLG